VKYNDFVTFSFDFIFHRNRVELSVTQTCTTAQTTRIDAMRYLFGVSLMHACIEGLESSKLPKFQPQLQFQAKTKISNNFLTERQKVSTDQSNQNEVEESNDNVTSGLSRRLMTKTPSDRNPENQKTLKNSQTVANIDG
jgi:hypothetical protein